MKPLQSCRVICLTICENKTVLHTSSADNRYRPIVNGSLQSLANTTVNEMMNTNTFKSYFNVSKIKQNDKTAISVTARNTQLCAFV